MVVVPDNYEQYLLDAEKKGAAEAQRRLKVANGARYDQREDFDVTDFFNAGVVQAIEKCRKRFDKEAE